MFHFPAFPPHCLYIQQRVPRHDSRWVSPFGHPRITALLSTPRGFSQTHTSFVGSSCQGIHRAPFKTYGNTKTLCDYKNCLQDARVHYAVLKKQPHTNPTHAFAPDRTREDQPHTPQNPQTTPPQGSIQGSWSCVQPHNPIACLHLEPPGPPSFHTPKRSGTRQP